MATVTKSERRLNKDWLSNLWTFISNVSSQMVARGIMGVRRQVNMFKIFFEYPAILNRCLLLLSLNNI